MSTELPTKLRLLTIFTGGLFFFALLGAFYVAHQIIIPVLFAVMLKLFLEPSIRLLQRLHIPRAASAVVLIAMLIGACFLLGSILSTPAATWADKIPSSIPKVQMRLNYLSAPMETFHEFLTSAENATSAKGPKVMPVAIEGNRFSDRLLTGTRALLGGLLTTLLMLLFLMITGDTFLRRLIEILPRFQDKIQAVEISQHIERDIAAYLLTITVMNAVIGACAGIIMASFGIADPMLWATMAFFLNYIPFAGPLVATALFAFVGIITEPALHYSLAPAMIFFSVHLVESNFVTPQLLAKRFTLNPVMVIFSLIFWFWMWGIPGAVLSTPILAITKIICDRVQRLSAIGHFLEA